MMQSYIGANSYARLRRKTRYQHQHVIISMSLMNKIFDLYSSCTVSRSVFILCLRIFNDL